jgi:hypothetical protein
LKTIISRNDEREKAFGGNGGNGGNGGKGKT